MGLSSFPVTMLFFNWLILGGRASFPPPDSDAIALQCCPLPLVPQQSPNHAHAHSPYDRSELAAKHCFDHVLASRHLSSHVSQANVGCYKHDATVKK